MRRKKLIIIFSILCVFVCIILLSSVIFSVQHIYAECESGNTVVIDGDTTLDDLVLSNHDFKKGESIFLADKESAARSIEKNIPNVKVVSIEKKFPNRIYITYEILYEYFEVHNGGNFYILSDDCKITDIRKQSQDREKIVHVYLDGDIGTPEAGEYLSSSKAGEANVLSDILSSLKSLGQEYDGITKMFDFIDIRGDHEYIYLKTTTGVYFRFTSWKNIAIQMQWALTVYARNINHRSGGTITTSDLSDTAYYSPEVFYEMN